MISNSIGIMQPYFLPYLGYFSLIKHTSQWVVFDTVQYINKGWINRNRIQSQSKDGFSYMTVPVKKVSRDMLIMDTKIDNAQNWKQKIRGQIQYYKKCAPYYREVDAIVGDILSFNTDKILELNVYSLRKICEYLNIAFKFEIFSESKLKTISVLEPDEWALRITQFNKATTYINPPGGKSFFKREKYQEAGIDLKFLSIKLKEYETKGYQYIPGLSIIDVMMFNSSEEINVMLDNYEFD